MLPLTAPCCHLLPGLQTLIQKALMAVATHRRVGLTGYPLQNNLAEM